MVFSKRAQSIILPSINRGCRDPALFLDPRKVLSDGSLMAICIYLNCSVLISKGGKHSRQCNFNEDYMLI